MLIEDYILSPMFELNPQPMWIYRYSDLHIIGVNLAAISEYGYTHNEFLSLTTIDLRPEGELSKIMDVVKNESIGCENVGIWKHKRKDGSFFRVELFLYTLDIDGQLYKVAQVNKILHDQNTVSDDDIVKEQLNFHLKNTPLLHIEWDKNLRVRSFSKEFLTKYHFHFEDLFNRTYEELLRFVVDNKDVDTAEVLMKEVIEEKKSRTQGEIRFHDNDNNIIYTNWYNSILRNSKGEPVSILSLIEDNTARKLADVQLQQQNNLINAIINSLPGIFYMIDEDRKYVRWNKNFEKLLGFSGENLSSHDIQEHYSEEVLENMNVKIDEALNEGISTAKIHIRDADGQNPLYLVTGIPFKIEDHMYILGTGVDITETEQAQKKLSDSLHEKEVLLTEIHHRVKNNLAMISGMLELATFNVENIEAYRTLRNSMMRIQSMALIHEKLYHHNELTKIYMKRYSLELVDRILKTMNINTKVDLQTDIDDITMDVNQAIPTSLLINEIVSNCLEHAFVDRDQGIIRLTLKKSNGRYKLEISDDGIGLDIDKDVDLSTAKAMGLRIIYTLARQMEAEIDVRSNNGTSITLQYDDDNKKGILNYINDR